MSEQNDHHLSETPVDIAIQSLQRQVDQLKKIITKDDTPLTTNESNEEDLKEEIKQLRVANEKAEYRIKMLLRALEERDKK